jgi:environmental stress-induced protein Ves
VLKNARCIRHDDYIAMPWRNGAGITHEIAREPANGEEFSWRLSLASLKVNGPFSAYAGYERCVALVEGRGFRLNFDGARTAELRKRGDHALFGGASATRCELLDGPCTDLSLMVRTPGLIAEVSTSIITAAEEVKPPAARTLALFVLRGALALESSADAAASAVKLNLHETFLIPSGNSWSARSAAAEPAQVLRLLFAVP